MEEQDCYVARGAHEAWKRSSNDEECHMRNVLRDKLMELRSAFDLAHNDWRSVLTIELMYARFCAPTLT